MAHTKFDNPQKPRRTCTVTTRIWQYVGPSAWHFITLPQDEADIIKGLYGRGARGFGSIRVRVTCMDTTWNTSLFPDSATDSYVLPMKKEIRVKCGLAEGDTVTVKIEIY